MKTRILVEYRLPVRLPDSNFPGDICDNCCWCINFYPFPRYYAQPQCKLINYQKCGKRATGFSHVGELPPARRRSKLLTYTS